MQKIFRKIVLITAIILISVTILAFLTFAGYLAYSFFGTVFTHKR